MNLHIGKPYSKNWGRVEAAHTTMFLLEYKTKKWPEYDIIYVDDGLDIDIIKNIFPNKKIEILT